MTDIVWFRIYQKSGRSLSLCGSSPNKAVAIKRASWRAREFDTRTIVREEHFAALSGETPLSKRTVWDSKE